MTKAYDDSVTRTAGRIEEEAARWLVRVDARDSPETWASLDDWLAQNPRNRAAFVRLSIAWQHADALRRLASLDGRVDIDLLAPEGVAEPKPTASTTPPQSVQVSRNSSRIRSVRSTPFPSSSMAGWLSRTIGSLSAHGTVMASAMGASSLLLHALNSLLNRSGALSVLPDRFTLVLAFLILMQGAALGATAGWLAIRPRGRSR